MCLRVYVNHIIHCTAVRYKPRYMFGISYTCIGVGRFRILGGQCLEY